MTESINAEFAQACSKTLAALHEGPLNIAGNETALTPIIEQLRKDKQNILVGPSHRTTGGPREQFISLADEGNGQSKMSGRMPFADTPTEPEPEE